MFKIFRRNFHKLRFTDKDVVIVTGCDSGLGYNIAKKCHELGLFVIAGCFSTESKGAKKLNDLNLLKKNQVIVQNLNLTNDKSIEEMKFLAKELVSGSDQLKMYGLVNNAACMVFGEFEWLTPNQIANQLNVNLLGTVKLTHSILPMLRSQQSGRIINVTSHCGIAALPGLSVYAASKVGNRFWTNALRMELKKYNVQVVDFIPGSFVLQSNIMARQEEYKTEMWNKLNEDQREFYSDYFNRYNDYLIALKNYASDGTENAPKEIIDNFEKAISAKNPKRCYKTEPLRYKIYHFLFNVLPNSPLRDNLIEKFIGLPKYNSN